MMQNRCWSAQPSVQTWLWNAAAAAAATAADAEWNPQENGKPSSTEYIGMRSLHQREGPEKKEQNQQMENSYSAIKN